MPKGNLDTIKARADAHSKSVNGFINRANRAMEKLWSGTRPLLGGFRSRKMKAGDKGFTHPMPFRVRGMVGWFGSVFLKPIIIYFYFIYFLRKGYKLSPTIPPYKICFREESKWM